MTQSIDCPYCEGKAHLKKEWTTIHFRKIEFKAVAHFYKCISCKESFTTTASDQISLTQVHNQYREKFNIPFPEDMIALREAYELSATKMSEVLGLGVNGFSNYENGEIPTPAFGNLINAATSPATFLSLLKNAKVHFSENGFKKVLEKAQYFNQLGSIYNNINASINIFNIANNYTGYRKPDAKRIANLIVYFITNAIPEFNDKLKINKLLFFADFTHYKNHGKSISGLSYRAIKYGPVPSHYDNIYTYLENEQIITAKFIKLHNGAVREIFQLNAQYDDHMFSVAEKETLKLIHKKFSSTPTWDLVELSHDENAWKQLESSKGLIGYQDYAFTIKSV